VIEASESLPERRQERRVVDTNARLFQWATTWPKVEAIVNELEGA
jgi:hypothetical protein